MYGASWAARAGFAAAATISSAVAAYLYVRGNPEWIFFASITLSAAAQLASTHVRPIREGFRARLTLDASCLALLLATAVWLWLRLGSAAMLVNAVIVGLIIIIYALLTITTRRMGGEIG